MANRRIDYTPDDSPLSLVLDQLGAYQRHTRSGETASAALAARSAETEMQNLVDDAIATAITPPSSARTVHVDTGIPVSTLTYRARRHRAVTPEVPEDLVERAAEQLGTRPRIAHSILQAIASKRFTGWSADDTAEWMAQQHPNAGLDHDTVVELYAQL